MDGQMQRMGESEQISTRLSPVELREVDRLIKEGLFLNRADFFRTAVREKLESLRVIKVRKVSKETAREEIIDFLATHKRAYPSDIADALSMDIDVVFATIRDLIEEGRIR